MFRSISVFRSVRSDSITSSMLSVVIITIGDATTVCGTRPGLIRRYTTTPGPTSGRTPIRGRITVRDTVLPHPTVRRSVTPEHQAHRVIVVRVPRPRLLRENRAISPRPVLPTAVSPDHRSNQVDAVRERPLLRGMNHGSRLPSLRTPTGTNRLPVRPNRRRITGTIPTDAGRIRVALLQRAANSRNLPGITPKPTAVGGVPLPATAVRLPDRRATVPAARAATAVEAVVEAVGKQKIDLNIIRKPPSYEGGF